MTRVALEPAWILHSRPYRDTSALLELLTSSRGRVGLVARGVRSSRSRTRGLLQPFQPLLVSWTGRGELGTLGGVERRGVAPRMPGARLMAGFYVNELLLKLLEREDPHAELFDYYGEVIAMLAGAPDDHAVASALRVFEKRLLDGLGYGLNLTHEGLTGREVQAGESYHYQAEHGPVLAGVAEGGHRLVSGAALQALAQERPTSPAHLRELQPLLREAIDGLLGGRRLQTGEVARASAELSRRVPVGEVAPSPRTDDGALAT